MATKAQQGLVIYKSGSSSSNSSSKTATNILVLIKKTGYANVTVGGKTYYYDSKLQTNKITNSVLVLGFTGSTTAKKGTITVKKK